MLLDFLVNQLEHLQDNNKIKKMKINKTIEYLILLLGISIFSSCDKGGDPDPGRTTISNYAGDWYISLKDQSGAPFSPAIENEIHSTYNTSANDNTMWIDDHKNGYEIKCKVIIDVETGLFNATVSPNLATNYDPTKPTTPSNDPIYANDTVTITDGKIIKGGATSKGGHTVDKISFRAHFSYDAVGTDVLYDGHKRTGFLEDEY